MTLSRVLPRLALALVISAAAIWLALDRARFDPALIETFIRDLGAWAPFGHVASFALGTVLFAPGAIFGLAGGALFGPLWGTLLNLCGATLGATAAFLVARHLAADWVRRRTGARLARMIAGVEAEGWRFVLFARLTPILPFNLLNYALGLTRIPLSHYVLASVAGMAPGALAFAWLGHAGRQALDGDEAAVRHALLALALLSAVAFLPRLVKRLRGAAGPRWIEARELADRLHRRDGIHLIDVRGPDEFAGPLGHIGEAQNLPLGELSARLREIEASRDETVVLVCRTDKRSSQAAALLQEAGLHGVRVLRGGMESWNQEGLPIAGRPPSPGDARRAS